MYFQTCSDVARRFDGHLAQYLGDGVLIYFGYPAAHEDDAQRAARPSLDIVEAVEALNAGLAVRIGIHTGLVVIDTVGEGDRPAPMAMGNTLHVAARLQSLAGRDQVIYQRRHVSAGARLFHV